MVGGGEFTRGTIARAAVCVFLIVRCTNTGEFARLGKTFPGTTTVGEVGGVSALEGGYRGRDGLRVEKIGECTLYFVGSEGGRVITR